MISTTRQSTTVENGRLPCRYVHDASVLCILYSVQDPVHTIVLKEFVQSQVNRMAQQLGEVNYKEIISNVDVETRDNLLEYVAL